MVRVSASSFSNNLREIHSGLYVARRCNVMNARFRLTRYLELFYYSAVIIKSLSCITFYNQQTYVLLVFSLFLIPTYYYLQSITLLFQSVTYRHTSRTLQRSLFWKNVKMYVIMGGVAAVAVYLIGAMACGGLKWGKCVG